MEAEIRALRRERHQVGNANVVLFTFLVIGVAAVLFWNESSRAGLITWAALLGGSIPSFVLTPRLETSFHRWYAAEASSKFVVGAIYGSITHLALPASEVHQALLTAMLVGIVVASTSYSAQLGGIHAAFVIPFSAVSISGFLVDPAGLTAGAVICSVAFLFAMVMAAEHRSTNEAAIETIIERKSLAAQLSDERDALRRANDQLDAQAWTDSLTAAANRAAVMRELERRLENAATTESAPSVTVAYVDLTGFKAVNDTFGHREGDLVLRAAADRLADAVDSEDLVGRIGGDEFVVVTNRQPHDIGDALHGAFEQPMVVGRNSHHLGAGVGISTAELDDSADELVRQADAALYAHKRQARTSSPWVMFDEALKASLEADTTMERRVEEAFDAGRIRAWFQPVVDMNTGEIVGAEALARWLDDETVHNAGMFIEPLVRIGLVQGLSKRMLDESLRLGSEIRDRSGRPFRINVNVPAPHLEWMLESLLPQKALDYVTLEITESDAIRDPQHAAALIEDAQRRGGRVLLDDFGMAYSSLALANQIPVDGLKIDRGFVMELADNARTAAVVSTIADLARRLDVDLVAEGVETPDQAAALLELGITDAQGFLYSPAVDSATFLAWIESGRTFGTTTLARAA